MARGQLDVRDMGGVTRYCPGGAPAMAEGWAGDAQGACLGGDVQLRELCLDLLPSKGDGGRVEGDSGDGRTEWFL